MAPVTIVVEGSSILYRRAERAVMSISVSSEGKNQEKVSSEVTQTSNSLQAMLRDLAPRTENGEPAARAAVTHWTMRSLSTGSYVPYTDKGNKSERKFTASTSFEVKFRDFAKLGTVATTLSSMPHVSIRSIDWRLTDKTKDGLGSQARKDAIGDAMKKAQDYAEAIGGGKLAPFEVTEGAALNAASAYQPQQRLMAVRASGGAYGDELNFEPEDVSVVSNITVKFSAEWSEK